MKLITPSKKQAKLLTWWLQPDFKNSNGIIFDGAIRSGKTVIGSISFILWAMTNFDSQVFGMAGKTIQSFKRNVLDPLYKFLRSENIPYTENKAEKTVTISFLNHTNKFFYFGGHDEGSQDLVQGFTSSGFFFDEVVLMPESFVNQAVARCSVDGATQWFNCNPSNPNHWFYVNWIKKAEKKNYIRLHFNLKDNPSLSKERILFYESLYSGTFYRRYILGEWTSGLGVIYSMFNDTQIKQVLPTQVKINRYFVTIDYGQSNATVFLWCGIGDDYKLYILDEYYHSGKDNMIQKAPSQYAQDLKACLAKWEHRPSQITIDPSAKGFISQIYKDIPNLPIVQANNKVLDGIMLVSTIMQHDMIVILAKCKNLINEIYSYQWDSKAQNRGEDRPVKQHDHCLDALRYLIYTNQHMFYNLIKLNSQSRLP